MTMTGERLKLLMERADVTPTELAKRLDVRPETVSRWLGGERHPKRTRLPEIAAVLQVTAADLEQEETPAVDAINHFSTQEAMPPPSHDEWERLSERERRAVGEIIRLFARRNS